MAFWSGEKLAQRLPSLITGFTKKNLDCASYRLCVGDQVFATSDKFAASSPSAPLVSVLKDPPDNVLRIRPGQFAFLMTHEVVRVPNDALALISIRAGYKFKGLINISGFHVDPGWVGKLLFSVYNAGPAEVIVERGDPMFLIVYADLDRTSDKIYNGASQGQANIKASLLTNMTEQVFSPLMLQRQLDELEKTTSALKIATYTLGTVAASVVGLAIACFSLVAAVAPGWFGVTLAKTLDAAGYEIKQKPPEARSSAAGDSSLLVDQTAVIGASAKAREKASEGASGKKQ